MSGYWDSVPEGTWTVVDPIDVINAISDLETSWAFDERKARMNLFGPHESHKALIVDLKQIKKNLDVSEYIEFMTKVNSMLGLTSK